VSSEYLKQMVLGTEAKWIQQKTHWYSGDYKLHAITKLLNSKVNLIMESSMADYTVHFLVKQA